MAYEQEDGGAVQGMNTFNVNASAENFRETSDQFAADAKGIKKKKKIENQPVKKSFFKSKCCGRKKTFRNY